MFLSPPQFCDSCCSISIEFTGIQYVCNDCFASVGVHPETKIPLGRMANGDIRRLRIKAHQHFDKLWKNKGMSRDAAYNWLSRELNLERFNCHIAMLNRQQLELTIIASQRFFIENQKLFIRRKEKKLQKEQRQNERTSNRIKARKSKPRR